MKRFKCPVCGYYLGFAPWVGKSASHESCPSCGIEFGYDDWANGSLDEREAVYVHWRDEWIRVGMPWRGLGEPPPEKWNPKEQLLAAGIMV